MGTARFISLGAMKATAAALAFAAASLGWCGSARADEGQADQLAPFKFELEPLKLAANPAAAPAAQADDWHVVFRLGLWGMSVDGDASVRGYDADFSMDFGDLLDDLNFAFMPGLEIARDRWFVGFNGVFAQLENEEHFSRTLANGTVVERGADVELDLYIADLAVGYRLWDIPLAKDSGKDMVLSIMPAIGIRYTYIDIEINPDRFESRSRDKDLWDPYVGGRVNLQFSQHLAWRTDGSVGGFGVGSDFAWAAQSFIDWRFHRNWELNLGYRAMYYDCEDGDFEIDLTMHGPWIGVSYYFE